MRPVRRHNSGLFIHLISLNEALCPVALVAMLLDASLHQPLCTLKLEMSTQPVLQSGHQRRLCAGGLINLQLQPFAKSTCEETTEAPGDHDPRCLAMPCLQENRQLSRFLVTTTAIAVVEPWQVTHQRNRAFFGVRISTHSNRQRLSRNNLGLLVATISSHWESSTIISLLKFFFSLWHV